MSKKSQTKKKASTKSKKQKRHTFRPQPFSGMTVDELLRVNEKSPLAASNDILGDGYLANHNSVYRNIRKTARAIGYRYVPEDFCGYAAMPLASLSRILEQKKIPYFPNTDPLEYLSGANPGVFKTEDLVSMNLKANYLTHESAHGIADWFTRRLPESVGNLTPLQTKILTFNLAESFANTCESLLTLDADNPAHAYFMNINSYMAYTPQSHDGLVAADKILGRRNLFKFLYYAYLFANFLYDKISAKGVFLVMHVIDPERELTKEESRTLASVFKYGFNLSKMFRTSTQEFFFKIQKIEGKLFELLDFGFFSVVVKTPEISRLLDCLADVVEKGFESEAELHERFSGPSSRSA